jgi:hypothetical protein
VRRRFGEQALVVSQVDHLDFSRPEVEENFLETTCRLARELDVAAERVFFVGNFPHRRQGEGPAAGEVPPGPGSSLRAALHEALRTGGVDRLRAWLVQLPPRLKEALQATVADQLRTLRQELTTRLRSTLDGMHLQGGGFEPALTWQVRLQHLADELRRDRNLFEAPAKALAESLTERFAALCPPDLPLEGERLRGVHRRVVLFLSAQAQAQLREQVLPAVFGAVGSRLQAIEREVGPFPFADQAGLADAWLSRQRRDADADWLEPVVRSLDAPLFAPSGPVGLSAADYRAVMAAKFVVVAQQAGGQVAERVLGHLADLGGEVARIIDSFGRIDPADEVCVNELLAAIA